MSDITIHTATLLYNTEDSLGEGPVWDHQEQLLYWVDIEGCKLHCHDPATGNNSEWSLDEMPGAAAPCSNGRLLLALESGLATFNTDDGTLIRHNALVQTDPEMRCNDGKCGPDGNFWIGTMHKDLKPEAGGLYRVDTRFNISLQIPKTTVSNGMAWSLDQTKFYFIDSASHEVVSYRFNKSAGTISHKKLLFKVPNSYGDPDGMCIDSEGRLWIAHWGGHCVRRWDPATGKVLERIEVPAPQVTSCCFGGENLDTLYITTARGGLPATELHKFPLSGGLFMHPSKVKGTHINYFREV